MKAETTRTLFRWHYWSGLISGVNLIILSLTGAILVFHEELEALMHPAGADARRLENPAQLPVVALQPIVTDNVAAHPEFRASSIGLAGAERAQHRIIFVPTESALATAAEREKSMPERLDVYVDPWTGEARPAEEEGLDLLHILFHLHVDLFAGRAGLLFLGLISLVFLFSTVSGFILYGPFMKQLAFGMIRPGSVNLAAADIHKFVGVVTLAFQGLMAFTGACLTLGTFVLQIYVYFELTSAPAPASVQTISTGETLADVDTILAHSRAHFAEQAEPVVLTAVLFPGGLQGDDYFVTLGEEPAGLKRFVPRPLLLDRHSGELIRELVLPWYIQLIAISQPFHFGNFGGWPVKVLYCILGLTTGALAVTGYVMYFARRRRKKNGESA